MGGNDQKQNAPTPPGGRITLVYLLNLQHNDTNTPG